MSTLSAHRRVTLKQLILSAAISVSALMTLSALIGSPPAQANNNGATNRATSSAIADVTIVDFAFDPQVVTITAGSSVRWTRSNTSVFTHTTTSDTSIWDSGDLAPGGIFAETFNTPGIYAYHCARHPFDMHGTVIVVAPPSDVSVAGPTEGMINTAYVFTATVSPITATPPITYMWQATGQSPVTHVGSLSDTIAFTWPSGATGAQAITATATNQGGSAASTHTITIASPSTVTDVSIVNLAFEPQVVTITVDSSVRWTNTDIVTHTSTSDTGVWDSGDLGPGGTFTETFNTLGVYAYHCNIHSQMRGTVVVLRNLYLPVVLRSFGP